MSEDFVRDIRLPKELSAELDMLLYQVKEEHNDLVIVVDGKEGLGKSRTGILMAAYCAQKLNSSFSIDNIHYSTEEYMRSCSKLGRYSVHILDEAGVILHRASSNTKGARRFTKFLQVCREGYNQVHILILPAYHILDGYVVNWRCKFVLHMYGESVEDDSVPTGKRLKRGAFKVYPSTNSLTEMWNLYQDRKVFIYPKQWYMHTRIPNCKVLSDAETAALYAKKDNWRNEFIEGDVKDGNVRAAAIMRKAFAFIVEKTDVIPNAKEVKKALGVTLSTAYEVIKHYNNTRSSVPSSEPSLSSSESSPTISDGEE